MSKYLSLVTILDKIREEAPAENKRYHDMNTQEAINNARARAFIHLFLKVKFGIIDFSEREKFVTDDTGDGGIDGYYIDQEHRKLYFIQSKFRTTERNFESKEITFEEFLSMDVKRITEGETTYEDGQPYNGKIQKIIRELQEISDIPKYKHEVIILANIKSSIQGKLKRLTDGFNAVIYNHERCYSELVFPLIAGTFYNISELKITINIDSNSAGHRIDYYVKTRFYECNVNAFFVPTIEIARIISKYKNSILQFNPRSYLDLASGSINAEIKKSITEINTNEFALFNNGITMLSDNTDYSNKVAKRNRAEVIVTNPQIINGGQTAFTLSNIYDDCLKNNRLLDVFEGKEVLLKIITFSDDGNEASKHSANKLQLIEDISKATNQQSPITEADRRANDKVQVELQRLIFEEFGLFYERKRGEFGDGIKSGYIDRSKILDRELFLKICLASQMKPSEANSGQTKMFNKPKFDTILPNTSQFRKFLFAYRTYINSSTFPVENYGNGLRYGRYAVTSVVTSTFKESIKTEDFETVIPQELKTTLEKWLNFESFVRKQPNNKNYFREVYDRASGNKYIEANWSSYYKGSTLVRDLNVYFKLLAPWN